MKNILIPKTNLSKISVFLIWLFHTCGLIGILYIDRELFLQTTPFNLSMTFILLFFNLEEVNKKVIIALTTAFIVGMIAETIGVNFGILFGDYEYGENLGFKIFGVPFLIGINWIVLTFITGSISSLIFKNSVYLSALLGSILMVILDIVIEPVAPKFDYWVFSENKAPVFNYLSWFLIAYPIQLVYQKMVEKKENTFSIHLVLVHFLFFSIFTIADSAS